VKVVLLKRCRFSDDNETRDDDDDVVTEPNFALSVVINSVVLSPISISISISITPTTSAEYEYYYNTYQREREKQTEVPFFIVMSTPFRVVPRTKKESSFCADLSFLSFFFLLSKKSPKP